MNEKIFADLSARLAAAAATNPAKDLERNFRAMLAATFARLDLVTREEFDVQRKVLEKTREKLDAIEAQIARMTAAGAASPTIASTSPSDSDPGA